MKGRIFRILPLLAGMALLACTTAGCSAGGKSREREETKEKETVWLTMFVENKSRYTGLQEDAVAQYIEERFGIRIKLTTDAALENSPKGAEAYKELLRTKLESNDLDDIMDFGPALTDAELLEMLQKSAKGGLLQPLDQLIGSSAPGLNEDGRISVRNDYRRDAVYEDGRTAWEARAVLKILHCLMLRSGSAGICILKWGIRRYQMTKNCWTC